VTIGAALGFLALGLAFGAAAARSRSPFSALISLALFGAVGYRIVQFGLDSTQLVTSLDRLLGLIGLLLLAALVTVTMGLPKSIENRLIYGPAFRIVSFERALWEARRPFLEAAATWDASMAEKARWRATLARTSRGRDVLHGRSPRRRRTPDDGLARIRPIISGIRAFDSFVGRREVSDVEGS
jgi:hypothetical protein